jgi:two-component system sensor histidine kinase VicK
MILYFLKSISPHFSKDFLAQTRVQNTKVMNAFAFTAFVFTAFSRMFILSANDYQLGKKYPHHIETNTYFIVTGLIFSLVLFWMYKKRMNTHAKLANSIAWVYSLLFIAGSIWLSFLSQHNPSNTMTLMLLGFSCVSVTTVFSLRQTIASIIFSLIVFSFGIDYFQTDTEVQAFNYIIFSIMLICFFIISRLIYSFHANYFIKVKTIEEKNALIEATDQSKNEILGIVAHDLRSPVSNIQSLIELMQDENTTKEEAKMYMDHIKDCCIKAEFIIREIIIAAQEESNTGQLKLESVNINDLLTETHRTWKHVVNAARNIQLHLPSQEIMIQVNKVKLQRVLDNLLSNAIKFTPENDGIITIALEKFEHSVRLSIKDNGIGIPPQQVPFLFDKFTTTGRIGLNNEPSVGLGLHISKQLIEKQGGKIGVETTEQKGSTFYLEFVA